MPHVWSLQRANGLQQSASLLQPYPGIVTHFIPMDDLYTGVVYSSFSRHDLYPLTFTSQYNPGQQSLSVSHNGANMQRHGNFMVGDSVGSKVG